ncbi:MAG: unnamed protein product [uncultured Paraburkholderia sp.]|nr:MAG: unnamed protein product [uncultured Paraburkholderia sp.]CAH2941872.1 MAG: unnamed protein product [uncultured Paraburkholderia sp.]
MPYARGVRAVALEQELTMIHPEQEQSMLALADRHIAEAKDRIAVQQKRVQDRQRKGADSSQSEKLLRNMQNILQSFTQHRFQPDPTRA